MVKSENNNRHFEKSILKKILSDNFRNDGKISELVFVCAIKHLISGV